MKKNIKKIVGVIACVTLLCAMTLGYIGQEKSRLTTEPRMPKELII